MKLLDKIKAIFKAVTLWKTAKILYTELVRSLQKGERLNDNATKTAKLLQLWGSLIPGLLALLGIVFGVNLNIPAEWVAGAGIALLGVFNGIITIISTRKIGLSPKPPPPGTTAVEGQPWLEMERNNNNGEV